MWFCFAHTLLKIAHPCIIVCFVQSKILYAWLNFLYLIDPFIKQAVSRRATLHERIRDYEQAARDLQRLITVLEKQSHEKAKVSGAQGRYSGNAKEIKQAHRHLSSMEVKAKNGTPLDLYLIL